MNAALFQKGRAIVYAVQLQGVPAGTTWKAGVKRWAVASEALLASPTQLVVASSTLVALFEATSVLDPGEYFLIFQATYADGTGEDFSYAITIVESALEL